MVARGEIYWANLAGRSGRRPVVILTRDRALTYLHSVTVAPITSSVRGIGSEVPVGAAEGLDHDSAVNCDNLITIPRGRLASRSIGALDGSKTRQLNRALRFALGIRDRGRS